MREAVRDSAAAERTAARICIAIPTFRRPMLLDRLLSGISALEVPSGCAIDVVVIDNDSAQSAHALVAGRRARYRFPLAYEHAAEPGLSSVRNFALAYARDGFDFLAMIDDDEFPSPEWLRELLRVQAATSADAVVGPVPHIVPREAPQWLRDGQFFALPVYADQATMTDGYSGNCLLDVSSVARLGVRFDPAMNFAGGEDLLFFRQLLRGGAKLVYAAGAVAEESIGPERLTADYIIRLNYRRGNTLSLCDRRLGAGPRGGAVRAAKACARIARGCASIVPRAIANGRAGGVAALCDIAHGAGSIAGLFGHTYQAYDRPSGS